MADYEYWGSQEQIRDDIITDLELRIEELEAEIGRLRSLILQLPGMSQHLSWVTILNVIRQIELSGKRT